MDTKAQDEIERQLDRHGEQVLELGSRLQILEHTVKSGFDRVEERVGELGRRVSRLSVKLFGEDNGGEGGIVGRLSALESDRKRSQSARDSFFRPAVQVLIGSLAALAVWLLVDAIRRGFGG